MSNLIDLRKFFIGTLLLAMLAAMFALLLLAGGSAQAQADGAVSNLRITSPNPGELVIAWEAPSDPPTDYRVIWAPSDEGYLSYKDANTATKGNAYPTVATHTVSGLPEGTEYKVRLRARYNSGGTNDDPWSGPWTDEESVTISGTSTPEPTAVPTAEPTPEPTAVPTAEPTRAPDNEALVGLTLSSAAAGSLTIEWDAPSPAPDSYRIIWAKQDLDFPSYKDANQSNRGNEYPAGDATSITLTGLAKGATFKVMARARYADKSGPWSGEVSVRVKDDPPAAPTGLITASTQDSVTLSWDHPDDDGITGYRVLRGTAADSLSVIAEDTGSAAVSYTDDSLSPETTYHYAVAALSADGAGPPTTASATTLAEPESANPKNSPQKSQGQNHRLVRGAGDATGTPTVTVLNAFRVPAVLTASKGSIADTDGLPDESTFTWQWIRVDGTDGTNIPGATGKTYTLTDGDAGKTIKVKASFTDSASNQETRTSTAYPGSGSVLARAECNAPTYIGGAAQIWTATVTVGNGVRQGSTIYGYTDPGFGALTDNTFMVGTNTHIISGITQELAGILVFATKSPVPAADRKQVTLHLCDTDLPLSEVRTTGAGMVFTNAGLDWSDQAERTFYLSRDTAAPTVESAMVEDTSLVIAFNEDLAAASSLANGAFTVRKTPIGGTEQTVSLTGSPSISGKQVTLTLSSAVSATDTGIKVSYTQPSMGSNNKLADKFGNEVASFTDREVKNENVAVKFGGTSYSVAEDDTVLIPVILSANHERPSGLNIPVTLTGQGGAAAYQDYSGNTGVFFRYGQTKGYVRVNAWHDLVDDDDESVVVTFGTLPRGVDAMSPESATVSITDDDGPMDPAYGTDGLLAYWVGYDGSNSNSDPNAGTATNSIELNSCTGTRSIRLIWSNPEGKGNADEWEVYVHNPRNLSLASKSFGGQPGYPEMNGTVRMQGPGSLSMHIRGRWGTTWGTWSPGVSLFCHASGD